MTLYLSVAVTYPEGVDLSASPSLAQTSGTGSYGTTSVVVTEELSLTPGRCQRSLIWRGCLAWASKAAKWGDHTLQYLITLHFQDAVLTPRPGGDAASCRPAGGQHPPLPLDRGEPGPGARGRVGRGRRHRGGHRVFSPFAACLTFPEGSLLATEADRLLEALAFLDQAEAALPRFPGNRHHRRRHQCACDFGGPGLRPHDARGDSRSANRHTDLPGPLDRQPILTLCKPEGIPLRFFFYLFVAVSMTFVVSCEL